VSARYSKRRLSDEAVLAIRASTEAHGKVAARYGVCRHTIQMIRQGRTYKDVGGERRHNPSRALPAERAAQIRNSRLSVRKIAATYDVAYATVIKIKHRRGCYAV